MNSRSLTPLLLLALCALLIGPGGCDKLVTQEVTTTDPTLGETCLQRCHSDTDNRILRPKGQWENSKHFASAQLIDAVVTLNTKPKNVSVCGPQCHTNEGYIREFDKLSISGSYTVIGCFTCHQPHTGDYNTWSMDTLRALADSTLLVNDSVYAMGKSNMCANCHQATNAAPTSTTTVFLNAETFGPHFGAQADILNATGGFRFSPITITGGNHRDAVKAKDGCLSCHFGTGQGYEYGEHTFRLQSADSSFQYTANCNVTGCHLSAPITDFYNYASIDSITTLADSLKGILQDRGYLQSDGVSFISDQTIPARDAKMLYNYLLYVQDGSRGVHNPKYMLALLKQTTAQIDSFIPTAAFTTTDTVGCAPLTVNFDGLASQGVGISWHWNFGDADSSTGINPIHTYDSAGLYTVRLIVVNAGGSDTLTRTNYVRAIGTPFANFATADSVVLISAPIVLTSLSTLADSLAWSVTDSLGAPVIDTTTTAATLQITLADAGLYSVSLTAFGICGSDDTTITNMIRVTTTVLGKLFPAHSPSSNQ